MSDINNILIRKFKDTDREDTRRISCQTAFPQKHREDIFEDKEILADFLTLYFTDYEPDSCFVADIKEKVVGYIFGSTDTAVMRRIFSVKIMPRLIVKAVHRGTLFKSTTRRFLLHLVVSFLKGEFFLPDFSKQYPATLHVNVNEDFRRQRIGTQLVEYYIGFLKEKRVGGIHFGVMSEAAKNFFTRFGFDVLFASGRTYLRPYIGRDITYCILGKAL